MIRRVAERLQTQPTEQLHWRTIRMDVLLAAIVVVVAYFLGTFPSAELVARRSGTDISKVGSGNPGASNVIRSLGWKAGLSVFAMDMAKAAIGIAIAWSITGEHRGWLSYAALFAAVVGHTYPVTRRFKGGKGVASGGGGLIVLFPITSFVCLVTWFVVSRLTRKASVASLVITILTPIGMILSGALWWEVAVVVALALFIIVKHLPNIRRLRSRSEPSL
jgi:glycerol-3-phosphate acyltransferase PlsY